MHNAIMAKNRMDIIHLVMRSTPFCRPRLHTRNPMTTAASIQPKSSEGFASIALNAAPVVSAVPPSNMPDAILGT